MSNPSLAWRKADVIKIKGDDDDYLMNFQSGIENISDGRKKLESWLNKNLKISMSDGRTLVGIFVCTDRDRNVILGSCQEYLHPLDGIEKEEPRILGLAMIPGSHIVSISVDQDCTPDSEY